MRKIRMILALLLAMSLLTGMGTAVFAEEGTSGEGETNVVEETIPAILGEMDENPDEQPMKSDDGDMTTSTSPAGEDGQTDTDANVSEIIDTATNETQESKANDESMPIPSENTGAEQSEMAEDDDLENAAGDPSPTLLNDAPTYTVSISWTGMSFTYHAESGGTWNTDGDTIGYTAGTPAYWSSSDGDKNYGTITIEAENLTADDGSLTVTLKFTQDPNFTAGELAMRFSYSSSDVGSADPTQYQTALNSGNTERTVYAVPAVAGDMKPFSNDSKLGTVTLTIAAGGNTPSPWTDPVAPNPPEVFD